MKNIPIAFIIAFVSKNIYRKYFHMQEIKYFTDFSK